MGKILITLLILLSAASALVRPWIGVMAYYLLAILGPQYIWWWDFEGLRVSLWVAIATFVGIALKLGRHEVDFDFMKTRLNFCLLVLWIFLNTSYYLGPYIHLYAGVSLPPSKIHSITNKIFLFYFCATLVANDLKSLRYLAYVFIGSTLYMIYWANHQYLSHNWSQFQLGRLMGPRSIDGSNLYGDENAFAMLFVTGIPFLYYLSFEVKCGWRRYLLWGAIPLGWSAVFLTASRGGLLGLGSTTLLLVLQSKRKFLALVIIIPLFFAAFVREAGHTMLHRSDTITSYQEDASAQDRLDAWTGALRMIAAHPITGVGLGAFATALPDFYHCKARVAHDTFFQYAAESGVGAGLAYLMIVALFFLNFRGIDRWCKDHEDEIETHTVRMLNKASTVSFAGLFICSIFLSLNIYEIFFFLLIFNNSLAVRCQRSVSVEESQVLVAEDIINV